MSDALGKPWIESAVTDILVKHAHELPSPPLLQGRAQIVKFLTFRKETGDGGQPADRETELWAEITDRQWVIPVRIANEATNKLEDQEKRALTYYRRGFFTLKAAVAYRFVPTQGASFEGRPQIQFSNKKSLVLDIVELSHISGGGPGAPVATNSAALEPCPIFRTWEDVLSIGGRTLINKQNLARITLEATRASKTSLRRSASNNSSKKGGRTLVKMSSKLSVQQPVPADLTAFYEFQDAIWGKRSKYRDTDFAFGREFDVPLDQQKILKRIEERIKVATPSQPYDPLSTQNGSLSAPNDLDDLPSLSMSQVYTSTPLDAYHPPSSPTGSEASHIVKVEPGGPTQHVWRDASVEDDGESDREDDDLDPIPDPGEETGGLESSPRPAELPNSPDDEDRPCVESHNTIAASRLSPDTDVDVEGSDVALDEDDAVAEKILTQNNDTTESASLGSSQLQPRQPVVLVPDSDPLSQSQRRIQLRESSPAWDCENVAPSQARNVPYSPEVSKSTLLKGKQRFSPMLSSPPQFDEDAVRTHPDNTQASVLPNDSQNALSGSGQVDSQSSAAASLPSPPPEIPSVPDLPLSHLDDSHNEPNPTIANEPTNLTEPLIYEQGEVPQSRDLRDVPNKQPVEPFHAVPRTEQTLHETVRAKSQKRRRSQSPSEDTPKAVAQRTSTVGDRNTQAHETKRRRLEHSTPTPRRSDPHKPDVRADNAETAGEQTETRGPVSNAAETDTTHLAPTVKQGNIAHDQQAWSAPSWMNSPKKGPTKDSVSGLRKVSVPPSSTTTSKPLSKSSRGQALKPKSSLLPPPAPPPRRQSVRPPTSPTYPPVTASQFEDANEDLTSSTPRMPKVELASQRSNTTTVKSSRPSISSRASTSTPTRPIASRPRRNPVDRDSIATKENLAPPTKAAAQPTKTTGAAGKLERNANVPDSDKAPSKPHGRDSSTSAPRGSNVNAENITQQSTSVGASDSPARRLLGGFRPSVSLDLDEVHMFTWSMWQDSMREVEAFWKESSTD